MSLVGKQVGMRGDGGGEPQGLGLVRGEAARHGQVSDLRAPSVPCTALAIPRSVCEGGVLRWTKGQQGENEHFVGVLSRPPPPRGRGS